MYPGYLYKPITSLFDVALHRDTRVYNNYNLVISQGTLYIQTQNMDIPSVEDHVAQLQVPVHNVFLQMKNAQ